MTDPRPAPPETTPGERRLARPPSDRYPTEDAGGGVPEPSAVHGDAGSVGRGVTWGVLVGIAGAAAVTLLGGALGTTAGLIVIALLTGWAVAKALTVGAGPSLAWPRRPWVAVVLVLAAVALGQLGLWLYARTEGGVLAPLDFLAQTYGPLVPLQAGLAAVAAWWTAR